MGFGGILRQHVLIFMGMILFFKEHYNVVAITKFIQGKVLIEVTLGLNGKKSPQTEVNQHFKTKAVQQKCRPPFFIFPLPIPAKKMTIRQRDKDDMNIYTAISLGIAIAGFIGGVVVKVADLSSKYGRLQEKVKNNEDRDTEERQKTSAKFAELYNRMSANESSVNALQTNVNNLTATCNRIESKLDRIIEREAK